MVCRHVTRQRQEFQHEIDRNQMMFLRLEFVCGGGGDDVRVMVRAVQALK